LRLAHRQSHTRTRICESTGASDLEEAEALLMRRLQAARSTRLLGHRLRAAGVGFEDRKLLLGHKSNHVTTHYSAPELGALISASEMVCDLRVAQKSRNRDGQNDHGRCQVIDLEMEREGRGRTRTLTPRHYDPPAPIL
jgi:hypothetical protein